MYVRNRIHMSKSFVRSAAMSARSVAEIKLDLYILISRQWIDVFKFTAKVICHFLVSKVICYLIILETLLNPFLSTVRLNLAVCGLDRSRERPELAYPSIL